MALSGCSRSYERPVNDWCRVRVREPVMGGGGMVQAGPDQKETLSVRKDGRWREVGHGSYGRVMRLAGDRAVFWFPSLGAPGLIVTPDGARPSSEVFPCAGWLTVSPDGAKVDCGTCPGSTPAACGTLFLERRGLDGSAGGSATADAGSGCRFRKPGVLWYDDSGGGAYALAECADGSRVLFRTDFATDVERFTSPRAIDDRNTWSGIAKRLIFRDPKGAEDLRGTPLAPIRR
jgi:hypothetical protein